MFLIAMPYGAAIAWGMRRHTESEYDRLSSYGARGEVDLPSACRVRLHWKR